MFASPRDLTTGDIPSAMELSVAAGWNQIPEDWNRILRLSPHGCRCVEIAGAVAATTTLLAYGTELGWVGMVLTRSEYRRQGLASRLMEDAIASAERIGLRTLKLDATDEGRPLYESFGFVVEGAIERWGRENISTATNKQELSDGSLSKLELEVMKPMPEQLLALDQEAFGASRGDVLRELAGPECEAATTGYVLSRAGRTARSLGPCVASSEDVARRLIAQKLDAIRSASTNSEGWYWDLLPANGTAVKCAKDFGFTRRRALWRMRRGEPIKNNDALVFATAGFELG